MVQIHPESDHSSSFARLMRLGEISHAEGHFKLAHKHWRQAALLQPENEQVWLALLRVLENDEDRRVCLRNILTINPLNYYAQEMLDELVGDTQPPYKLPLTYNKPQQQEDNHKQRAVWLLQLLLVVCILGILVIFVTRMLIA